MDDDFDEEMIAQIMGQFEDEQHIADEPVAPAVFQQPANPALRPPGHRDDLAVIDSKEECIENIMTIFPGICEEYVSEIYGTVSTSSDRLIAYILDKVEKGIPYPNAREKQKVLKRKRNVDEDEEVARKYGAVDRIIPSVGGINTGLRGLM